MLLPLELTASGQWPSVRRFCEQRVQQRQAQIDTNIARLRGPLTCLLKMIQAYEPRFCCTDPQTGGALASTALLATDFPGLRAQSTNQFELCVYLQQLGVFTVLDHCGAPGCVALKLADGRKRSMSLWVEFITASGYLSARKIRARFYSLVAQVLEKNATLRSQIELLSGGSEICLRVLRQLQVHVNPAFRCNGPWPLSACHWPPSHAFWPDCDQMNEIRCMSFDLVSQESLVRSTPRSHGHGMQPDCWVLNFTDAEQRLLVGEQREMSFLMLQTLKERHLEAASSVITMPLLRTLLLFECEKHPNDHDWLEACLPYRLSGILLQLISCLQSRSCPHFFVARLDLLADASISQLEHAARLVWILTRELLTNPCSFDRL